MSYRREHSRRRSRTRVLAVFAAVVIAYAGILVCIHLIGERIEKKDISEAVGSLNGRFNTDEITLNYVGREMVYRRSDLTNILLIGIDWMDVEQTMDTRYDGQADFLMLLTLDRKNRSISYLQIDRDTVTPIRVYSAFGAYTGKRTAQICLSQAFGDSRDENCRNTVWAVSNLLKNIPIDYYMAMDIGGIVALNDALGGVTVTLEEDFSMLDPQMTQGATLTLQGRQAEYYVRGRMGIGDGANQSRMRRQRHYIQSVIELVSQGLLQDMNYAGALLDEIESHLVMSIDRGQLINKAYESRAYERQDVRQIAGQHIVGHDGFVEFHADNVALSALLADTFFE